MASIAREVSEEEGSYASRFWRWFWESFKWFPFAFWGFARCNWNFFAQLLVSRSLPWLSMTSKVQIGTWHRRISSAWHSWPELWHYICCFVQSREAFTVKGNKHILAQTHTHTHTHTHTCTHNSLLFSISW